MMVSFRDSIEKCLKYEVLSWNVKKRNIYPINDWSQINYPFSNLNFYIPLKHWNVFIFSNLFVDDNIFFLGLVHTIFGLGLLASLLGSSGVAVTRRAYFRSPIDNRSIDVHSA